MMEYNVLKVRCFVLSVLCLFAMSCSKVSKEQVLVKDTLPKPNYRIDLHVWHRRNAFTEETWNNLKNGATVHYMKHKLVPMFRMFTISFLPKDSIYEYQIGNAELKTYCADTLVETNKLRRFGGPYISIYSGQNGLLDCTDREKLYFNVYYRLKSDTLQSFEPDTIGYEIIMDREEY